MEREMVHNIEIFQLYLDFWAIPVFGVRSLNGEMVHYDENCRHVFATLEASVLYWFQLGCM